MARQETFVTSIVDYWTGLCWLATKGCGLVLGVGPEAARGKVFNIANLRTKGLLPTDVVTLDARSLKQVSAVDIVFAREVIKKWPTAQLRLICDQQWVLGRGEWPREWLPHHESGKGVVAVEAGRRWCVMFDFDHLFDWVVQQVDFALHDYEGNPQYPERVRAGLREPMRVLCNQRFPAQKLGEQQLGAGLMEGLDRTPTWEGFVMCLQELAQSELLTKPHRDAVDAVATLTPQLQHLYGRWLSGKIVGTTDWSRQFLYQLIGTQSDWWFGKNVEPGEIAIRTANLLASGLAFGSANVTLVDDMEEIGYVVNNLLSEMDGHRDLIIEQIFATDYAKKYFTKKPGHVAVCQKLLEDSGTFNTDLYALRQALLALVV